MNDFACVMKKYSDYFYQTSTILHGIEDTLSGLQFDEKTQAVEVFAAQSLSMSRDHCRAIGLLLNYHLFAEAIAICRSLFELSFDLVWIQSINDQSERLECVYKLEADPYFHMNKEVKLYEEDVRISSVLTSEEKLKQFNRVIERTKQGRSYLTIANAQGNIEFKRAPSLAERMGHDLRLQYYSIYSFMSLFIHPSPILKELHLQNVKRKETVDQSVEKSLNQILADVFLFVEIIAKTVTDLLATCIPNKSDNLKIFCEELSQRTEKNKC
jgi:hypothetical protein